MTFDEVLDQVRGLPQQRGRVTYRPLKRRRSSRTCQLDGRGMRCPSRQAIEADLCKALSDLRETGFRAYEPYVHLELAEIARLVGDGTTRQRGLREAYRLFTEIGAPIRAAEVAKELGL